METPYKPLESWQAMTGCRTNRWVLRNTVMKLLTSMLILVLSCGSLLLVAQNQNQTDLLNKLHPRETEKPPPAGIKLLPGYRHKGATDFEGNATGQIWKKGGLKIKYAMGLNWGQEADPKNNSAYIQYSEQTINGRAVRFAFTKDKRFIISVPFDDTPNTFNAANFSTNVSKPENAADMKTMALSLLRQ
jgi:hypothetical protein